MKTKKIKVKNPSMFAADALAELFAAGYRIQIRFEEQKIIECTVD
jgi:hypothetical protein